MYPLSSTLFFRERDDTGVELLSVNERISSTVSLFAECPTEGDSVTVISLLRCLLLPIVDTELLVGDVINDDSASLSHT